MTAACVNTGTVAGRPITPLLLGPVLIALHWPAMLRQVNTPYHPLTPQQRSPPYLVRWLLGLLVAGGPAAVPLWSVSVTPDA
ncbi:hypothetical protein [Streptomyces mirabilis]